MGKEIALTPKELYYLGILMQAEFIDYDYVAIMEDIESNYAGFQSECEASLTQKGILIESFTGNAEIDKDADRILNPIFFGRTESSVNDMDVEKNGQVEVTKFHFLQDSVTMVREKNRELVLREVTRDDMRQFIADLLNVGYNQTEKMVRGEIKENEYSRLISFKNTCLDSPSSVNIVAEIAGVFYRKNATGEVESLTKQEFEQFGYEWIKGVA